MELPSMAINISRGLSSPSLCPKCSFHCYYRFHRQFPLRRLKLCGNFKRPRGMQSSFERHSSSSSPILNLEGAMDLWEETEIVEVIGIGSRKDAVLDFCLRSASLSPCLRFWNIIMEETFKVQLQQRLLGDDITKTIVEEPVAMASRSKAVILVAGASYGSDLTTVHDIFEAIKLANGFVVTIILKPFRFEGRRRQDEVKDLLNKLEGLTDFCIMVDADALLEKDLVTLDEALQIANNAVLMALNAVSVLTSEHNRKFLDIPHEGMKELGVIDLKKILGGYEEAKIGYGVGYDIETSVVQAIYDCPFLSSGVKDINGIVVFILASSAVIDSHEMHGILRTFRQAAEWEGDIITSLVHEPDMSPNSFATTIFTIGCIRHESPKKDGIFSRLVRRFPYIFNILRPQSQLDIIQENSSLDSTFSPQGMKPEKYENPNVGSISGSVEGFHNWSSELQSILSDATDAKTLLRDHGVTEQSNAEFPQATFYNESAEGSLTLQRELLINRRPGYLIAEEAANETNKSGDALMLGNLNIYKLPVGVKLSGDLKDGPNGSRVMHYPEENSEPEMKDETRFSVSMSFDESPDASLQTAMDFSSSVSARQNRVYPDGSKKNGTLSARAASMLESERESQKKWSPVVEINYRGGIYVGRCQGGLPEGKGRLSLGDGSMYDGLWRYGKRSGLGTFCFSNGDVFRGSWRDDVMHGKGWFYFHTGDRWFVNFWKGKANGEGRFYSTNGDIFFGHFKNGWRDGHFLCIDVSGSRYVEIWDEGMLVSRKQLESDDSAG
ncbi:protein ACCUMULATION AND REPLICATION OF CHLOROPLASTS 3 isoform X1 [Cynara cardunculus var. scolymus]|uniref:protein ACCUMULATION AND REPLICATION OF CHLOROPLASTS 3 isoform X1 n=1 Tax=Cynara cardunculus var. scolymus TaxID=59895 RepID=UPI000D630C5C|nr:protein ACCUMULATION AND REPLICATION OF CHLOROPLASTS 3 isoform X1 [Cynara cardunculus var. scolymus]